MKERRKKMYRVQVYLNTNTKRGKVLLDSMTCPTKEIAERKLNNLKTKYCSKPYSDYEVIMFEI